MSSSTKLYYDPENTNHVTVEDYQKLVEEKNKEKIAEFIYNRLYSRYLNPFEYKNKEYITHYKNGFSMMASFCLLIETLQCFKVGKETSDGYGRQSYKDFFKEFDKIECFKGEDVGEELYKNIRCGILHQGETKNGWVITRKSIDINPSNFQDKVINANEFMEKLKKSLEDYKDELKEADWNSETWENLRKKMNYTIELAKK